MVKFASFFLIFLSACSGPTLVPTPRRDPPSRGEHKLWSKKLDGFVSDLNISTDGSRVLVALSPDFESAGGARHFQLALLDSAGQVVWKIRPEAPIREQAISPDGTWAVYSSYDDKLNAIDLRTGKKLWVADGTCRPSILGSSRKIVCYHDDDADSNIAFDVYSGDGAKLLSYPIAADSLGLKISPDQNHFALALTHGQVILFDSDFRALWQVEVPGEIVDLDVSPGPAPQVAVLLRKTPGSSLLLLDSSGKSLGQVAIPFGGRKAFFSGGSSPQVLVQGLEKGRQLATLISSKGSRWTLDEPLKAEALLPAVATDSYFILQEDSLGLKILDLNGRPRASFAGAVEGESILYAQAYAPARSILALATDKGEISLFEIGK